MKKQIITLIILALLPLVASADAVEIGGIYYNLVSKAQVAEVTNKPNNYSGDIIIPEKVIYKGIEYCVNSIGERAFSGAWDMTSVSIPNSITTIGDFAFYGYTLLVFIKQQPDHFEIGFQTKVKYVKSASSF